MKELLDKISSYNIFNYLLPGIVFTAWFSQLYDLTLNNINVVLDAFICYFFGLVVSRFGSIVIEPIIKFFKIVKYDSYSRFIKASKKDEKLDVLSETNNMYRTFIALFCLIGLIYCYSWIESKLSWLEDLRMLITIILLIVLFLLSFKKQTKFINDRIKANIDE